MYFLLSWRYRRFTDKSENARDAILVMLTKRHDTTVNIYRVIAQGVLKIKMFVLFRKSLKLRNEKINFPGYQN